MTTISYRASHLAKGADYHAQFSTNLRRRLLWSLEQGILDAIWSRYLTGRPVQHLDFACGTGRILGHFESRAVSSTGVDLSPAMLNVARSTTRNALIVQGDLTREDVLGTAEFDVITAFRFFPNAEADLRSAAITALKSHLKADGILVFNNHLSTASLRRRVARLVTARERGASGMSPAEVHALVATAGLRILRTYHAGIVPESEGSPWRLRWLIEAIERFASCLPMASLAENVIYVCCHRAEQA